ncbi:Nonribosomal peptide synthetase 2 [Neolecta irregularis DAH-3]|uniref:Nonribosomal peptide synthetase 2 n=1 Tax=Neolecta irregularis (strain DAH-3) TaxID=1198029 RepID=A0A1U7LTC9_NEOID|nr:Nonribosomal peptide synthetase 2 [Neolecta irregularis DAH-3]|eukprot:OLL25917.1 Nonribosomal peptide synthetase 2 [Neolecta irregularis DAH-3]
MLRSIPFPSLLSTNSNKAIPISVSLPLLNKREWTHDEICRAWATILCGIVGETTTVVFRCDENMYCIKAGEINHVDAEEPPTAIFSSYAPSLFLANHHYPMSLEPLTLAIFVSKEAIKLCSSAALLDHISARNILYQMSHFLISDSPNEIPSPSLSILNHDPKSYSKGLCLHGLFEDVAKKHCNTIALEFNDTTRISYFDLNRLSTNLANILIHSYAVTLGSVIPLLFNQSIEFYISVLAVLKAGAAWCPLSPSFPQERLSFVIEDVSANICITSSQYTTRINIPVLEIDKVDFTYGFSESPPITVQPDALAYIIYTSGSTGNPKGVRITHSNAVHAILAHHCFFEEFSQGRFLQFASPTFDISVFELFITWSLGWTLIAHTRSHLLSRLYDIVIKSRISHLELTPTVTTTLLRTLENTQVKMLLTIGEQLTDEVVKICSDANVRLYNAYGPTETAMHCSIASNFTSNTKVINIGVPLSTCSAYIMSPTEERLLPRNWVGELVIGGPQVSAGYTNYQSHAFFTHRSQRLYRTGDRARFLENGTIEFLGRLHGDSQFKISGQRVELGEIECVVRDITENIVMFIEGTLVCFVLEKLTEADQYARKKLLDYMIPVFLKIDRFPQCESGKLDRKRLIEFYKDKQIFQESDDSNWDDRLRLMRKIISEVSGVPQNRISKDSSFISLGIDSLKAILVVQKLQNELGEAFNVAQILTASNVYNLRNCSTIVASPTRILYSDLSLQVKLLIDDSNVVDVLPATMVQEAMISESLKDSKKYYNWVRLDIGLGASVPDFKESWKAIVNANEVLRTGFTVCPSTVNSPSHYMQVIYSSDRSNYEEISCGYVELDNLYRDHRDEQLLTLENMHLPALSIRIFTSPLSRTASLMIHHAIYDGWAMEIILNDINRYITTRNIVQRPQFRRVVELEYAINTGISRDYWKSYLHEAEFHAFPRLSRFVPAKPVIEIKEKKLKFELLDIERRCRELNIATQTVIQGAWSWVLSCYIGSSDITFGSVVSLRTGHLNLIPDVIGPAITTLPCRVRIQGSLEDLLYQIHQSNINMITHSAVSLRQICQDAGDRSLFDTVVVFQKTTNGDNKGPVKQVDFMDYLEYRVILAILPSANTITLRVTFDGGYFPSEHCTVMLDQINFFISTFLEDSRTSMSAITESSHIPEALLSLLNPNPQVKSKHTEYQNVFHLIDNVATGLLVDQTAIEYTENFEKSPLTLTYGQLKQTSDRIASHLLNKGLRKGDTIGLFVEKSLLVYPTILGILKIGGIYMPISTNTPVARILYMLETTGTKACLTSSDLQQFLLQTLECSIKIYTINDILQNTKIKDCAFPEVDLDDLAYIIFTSGSTGMPKACQLTHSNLLNHILVVKSLYPSTTDSRFLQFTVLNFDVSVFEIFFTLSLGLTLCVVRTDLILRDLTFAVQYLRITHVNLTSTIASLLEPSSCPDLTTIIQSGEVLQQSILDKSIDNGLINAYGPTELTNICTANTKMTTTVYYNNIGWPLSNTSAVILDVGGKTMIKGALGEVCFGGAQVFRGYVNGGVFQNECFFQHPSLGRLYRSGDFVRFLADGSINYVYRRDEQLKLRGHRIEPAEVNSAISKASELCLDAFTLCLDMTNGRQLVTFVVVVSKLSASETRVLINRLFSQVDEILPPYMIPVFIIPILRIPTSSNGKIDRKALEGHLRDMSDGDLAVCSPASNIEKETPFSANEQIVRGILSKICNISVASIKQSTSIFSLGIDSISAISLSARLFESGFKRLDISQIMLNPTLSKIVYLIEHQEPTSKQDTSSSIGKSILSLFRETQGPSVLALLGIPSAEVVDILPCTPLQDAMLASRTAPGSGSSYVNHMSFCLNSSANVTRLKAAWEKIIKITPALRTRFAMTSDVQHPFAQVVVRSLPIPWMAVSVFNKSDIKTIMKRNEDNIDTSNQLFQLVHFEPESQNILILSIHHVLYDGWAMSELLEDVIRVYENEVLPIRPSARQAFEYLFSLNLMQADEFWIREMNKCEPTFFPDLIGRKEINLPTTFRVFDRCTLKLSDIESHAKSSSLALLSLCQASWVRLLSALTGQKDLIFGNVFSGRTIPVVDAEKIIAPLFNTLPIRLRISEDITNRQLARSLQKKNAEILQYQSTPLRRILSITSSEALFDSLIILQKDHSAKQKLWSAQEEIMLTDFPVVVEFFPRHDFNALEFVITAKTSHITRNDAQIMLTQLNRIFTGLITRPDDSIFDYANTFEMELLAISNPFPAPIQSGHKLLHSAVEEFSNTTPEAIAVRFLGDEKHIKSFTYREINEKANQIADCLSSFKLLPDDVIAIFMEKSPRLYLSVLATLKAGAAFCSLDPSVPHKRICMLLSQLDAKIVLTSTDCKAIEALERSPHRYNVLYIDRLDLSKRSTLNPAIQIAPNNLAYYTFTSGSTGIPKAVMIQHKTALQAILASQVSLSIRKKATLLQFAMQTFDMFIYDIFLAWNCGICLASSVQRYLLEDLEGVINQLGVTHLDLTPTVASTLERTRVPKIERLFCIGEVMRTDLVNTWKSHLVNLYGPAECSMVSGFALADISRKAANIGKPLSTVSYEIRSDMGYLLPLGSTGFLHLSGLQLARGYWGDEKLTQKHFYGKDQHRYDTGDVVRALYDNTYEFVGRQDDQVKINGQRVDLGEINSIVQQACMEALISVTCIMQHPRRKADQIVTFVAPKMIVSEECQSSYDLSTSRTEADRILKFVSQYLPSYMVPQSILFLAAIPLSGAGKTNRHSLRDYYQLASVEELTFKDSTSCRSWSEDETAIRCEISQISGMDNHLIQKDTKLYQLGIDSITAIQLARRLRNSFKLDISVLNLMKSPDIAGISNVLKKLKNQKESSKQNLWLDISRKFQNEIVMFPYERFRFQNIYINRILPVTMLQQELLANSIQNNGGTYINHVVFELAKGLDCDQLKTSWTAVFRAVEVLRTAFTEYKTSIAEYVQIVYSSDMPLPFEVMEIASADISACLDNLCSQLQSRFIKNLSTPPVSLNLIKGSKSTYLLFSAHHALFDGWALKAIYNRVFEEYNSHTVTPPVPNDALIWQSINDARDLSKSESARSFWQASASNYSYHKFPDLNPEIVQDCITKSTNHKSYLKLSHVESFCRSRNISFQDILQAGWAKLLSMYLGEQRITFGTGRQHNYIVLDADEMLFPAIVTLPVFHEVKGSNSEFLEKVHKFNIELVPYRNCPLPTLTRWFDQSHGAPIFDTILIYQKTGMQDKSRNPDFWEIYEERATSDYSVSLEVSERSDGSLYFSISFKTTVLPFDQANALLRQFECSLIDILEQPYSDANRISTDVAPDLISFRPPIIEAFSSNINFLHEFVESHAKSMPNKIAVEFVTDINDEEHGIQRWSYTELNDLGNRVAAWLQKKGLPFKSPVGICFDKCPEAIFTILGILKSGRAFLALDPSTPTDRKLFVMRDSRVPLVISSRKQVEDLSNTIPTHLLASVEIILESSTVASDFTPVVNLLSSSPSYVLYTSGSTGKPKGCVISHESAVQYMYALSDILKGQWTESSKVFSFASFHFDVSVLEQYWTWSNGLTMATMPRDDFLADMTHAINTLRITHIDLTPSLAALLDPGDLPSIQMFMTGGDMIKRDIIKRWGPSGVLFNAYGPTEATIGCTLARNLSENAKSSNIGTAYPNCGLLITTTGTPPHPVLQGAVGELCVYGKQLATEYINLPELTADKFLVLETGLRVYRTGDLVRLLTNDTYEFISRIDDQIKLRGQRIEIGEINATIKDSSMNIMEVETLVLKHKPQANEQLVSFVVLKNHELNSTCEVIEDSISCSNDIQLLLTACQRTLAPYMVPTYVLGITIMPLTATNKIDRKRLASLFTDTELSLIQRFTAIRTNTTVSSRIFTKLRRLAADYTQISEDNIRQESTIFELGLDSITAIGFSKRMRDEGYAGAEVAIVLQNPKLIDLAVILQSLQSPAQGRRLNFRPSYRAMKNASGQLKTPVSLISQVLPCSHLQEGIILANLKEGNSCAYFNHFTFLLGPSINLDDLKNSLIYLIDSNDILRTCFVQSKQGYAQVILRRVNPDQHIFLINVEAEDTLSQVKSLQGKFLEEREPNNPPFRATIVKGPDHSYLSLTLFHAIYDGWSLENLLDDLGRLMKKRKPISRPPFHEALAFMLEFDEDKSKVYWRNSLSNTKPSRLGLPNSDHITAAAYDGELCHTYEAVEISSHDYHCTPQTMLQAAWALTIEKHSGNNVILGHVVSGRLLPIDDADKIVGPLFNTLPFPLNIAKGSTNRTFIQEMQKFNSSTTSYQHTPLRKINKWLGIPTNIPLFDTLFVFNFEKDVGDLDLKLIDSTGETEYDLALDITGRRGANLKVSIKNRSGIQTEAILQEFSRRLDSVLEHPDLIIDTTGFTDEVFQDHKTLVNLPETPLADVESDVVELVTEILAGMTDMDVDAINLSSSIFELGLDSIEAVQLSYQLKQKKLIIPVSAIMKHHTVYGIASQVKAISTNGLENSPERLDLLEEFSQCIREHLDPTRFETEDIVDIYPCSPLQEGMIIQNAASDGEAYSNHIILELSQETDLNRFCNAWRTVMDRHDILRTSFLNLVDMPGFFRDFSFAQIVHRKSSFDVKFSPEKAAPLRLFEKPPISLYVDIQKARTLVTVFINHALYDGWSLPLIFKDVESAYNGLELPRRPRFKEFVREALSIDFDSAEDAWKAKLQHASVTLYPQFSQSVSTDQVHRDKLFSSVSLELARETLKRLGITFQTLGQACWAIFLAHVTEQHEVLFGTVINGRNGIEGVQDVIGPAMTTIPVRVHLEGKTCGEILGELQKYTGDVLEFQHSPLGLIKKWSGVAGPALFDTLFIYQQGNRSEEHQLWKEISTKATTEFTVCAELEIYGETFQWTGAASVLSMSKANLERLLVQLDYILQSILEHSESLVSSFWEKQSITTAIESLDKDHPLFVYIQGQESGELPQNCTAVVVNERSEILNCGVEGKLALIDHWTSDNPTILKVFPQTVRMVSGFAIVPVDTQTDTCDLSSDLNQEWKETELLIQGVIMSVCNIPNREIAKDVSIFKIGLDSITAIRISAKLRKKGYNLSVGNMLRHPSIEEMSKFCGVVQKPGNSDYRRLVSPSMYSDIETRFGIRRELIQDVLLCLPAQKYFLAGWIKSHREVYMSTFYFKFSGVADESKFVDAWNRVLSKHSILRSTFIADKDQQLHMVIVKPGSGDIAFYDMSGENEWTSDLGGYFPDLYTPPIRARVFKGLAESIFVLDIHHALYDGWSMQMLLDDLERFYCETATESAYSSDIQGLSRFLEQQDMHAAELFWSRYLECPADMIPAVTGDASCPRTFFVKENAFVNLAEIEGECRNRGITLQAVFLALWAKIQCMYTGKPSALFGIYVSGRTLPIDEIENLMVPTVNIVPLYISRTGGNVFDIGESVQRLLGEIVNYQSVSLDVISRWAGSNGPLFNSTVNFVNLPTEAKFTESMFSPFALSVDVDVEFAVKNGAVVVGIFSTLKENAENIVKEMQRMIETGLD